MNDTELDDMLNKWEAPPVPRDLRQRIQPDRTPKRKFRVPSGMFFGLAAGAATFLLAVGVAAPQTFGLGPTPRFILMTETIDYKDDGSSAIQEYRRSTAQNGKEIIIDRRVPDSWFMTMHMNFFDAVHRLLGLEHSAPVDPDCSVKGSSVAGTESVMNYNTVVLHFDD
jgi:hypothetical protein